MGSIHSSGCFAVRPVAKEKDFKPAKIVYHYKNNTVVPTEQNFSH